MVTVVCFEGAGRGFVVPALHYFVKVLNRRGKKKMCQAQLTRQREFAIHRSLLQQVFAQAVDAIGRIGPACLRPFSVPSFGNLLEVPNRISFFSVYLFIYLIFLFLFPFSLPVSFSVYFLYLFIFYFFSDYLFFFIFNFLSQISFYFSKMFAFYKFCSFLWKMFLF